MRKKNQETCQAHRTGYQKDSKQKSKVEKCLLGPTHSFLKSIQYLIWVHQVIKMDTSNFAALSTLLPRPFSSLILLAVILLTILYSLSRKQNLPPGPWHLVPFLGYAPNIVYALYKGVPLYKYLVKLSQRYGSVYSFTALGIPFVILNDITSIRKAFQDTKLNDRGDNEMQAKVFSRSCKY